MGDELTRSLTILSERGVTRGATEVLDAARREAGRSSTGRARGRKSLTIAFAAAVAVLVLVGGAILISPPRGGQAPADTNPTDLTTIPEARRPQELVSTGAHLLTAASDYSNVAVDDLGFIWVGGDGHLTRFDPRGGDSRTWTVSDDLAFGEWLSGLSPARGGGVWAILGDSLRWFDGERFRDVVEPPGSFPDGDTFDAVVEAPDGSLWAASNDQGLFRWDGSSWSRIDDAGADSVAVDASGVIWFGNAREAPGGAVARYDGELRRFTGDDSPALSGEVVSIEPLSDGTVWVGTNRGVAMFDGASWSSFEPTAIGLSGAVSISVGRDGTVWAASSSGSTGAVRVARYDGRTWSRFGPKDGLPSETPWLVATSVASEDGVFVGTGSGLFRLDGDHWTIVPIVPARPDTPTDVGEATVPLAGVEGIKTSGGFLWAWGEDEIWRYSDGEWSPYSGTPGSFIRDLALARDGLWAVGTARLHHFDGDEWQVVRPDLQPWSIAVDPGNGALWVSASDRIHRWDGSAFTDIAGPGEGDLGSVVATTDGVVWASGLNVWVPWLGGLARYDEAGGAWATVRPLGGADDMPALALAATPDGGLWAILADWFEDWESREAAGEPTVVWTLAHRNPSGEWTVYDEAPPRIFPMVMAADDEAVWLAQGSATVEGFDVELTGVLRFDGETWENHLEGTLVTELAVAPDGTVWYVAEDGGLRRLER